MNFTSRAVVNKGTYIATENIMAVHVYLVKSHSMRHVMFMSYVHTLRSVLLAVGVGVP